MTDTMFAGWTDSGMVVVKDADPVAVPLGNTGIDFDSGFNQSADGKKLPASGGAYLCRVHASWSGWSVVPTEGFASLQLVHVAGDVETVVLNHETNSLNATEGYGDAGFQPYGGGAKLDLASIEGGGYFELRASQNADDGNLRLIAHVVIVKL